MDVIIVEPPVGSEGFVYYWTCLRLTMQSRFPLSLRFDFYLPEERILIEYDGLQHSQPVDFFGGEKAYESLVRRDQIKDDFAEATGMKLIRISGLQNVFLGVMNGILAHSSGSPSFGATCV